MFARQFLKAGIASLALVGAMAAAPAAAAVITFVLDETVEGDTPSGFPTLTFDDGGSSGTVTLTIDAAGLSGQEFISSVLFNYVDAATADDLVFTRTGGDGPTSGINITQTTDGENSPGNQGLFDIQFDYGTSADDATRFNADELLTFSIVGAGITANDFNVTSAPEGPNDVTNFALARIQGIGPNGEGSASVADDDGGGGIPVPEPAALGLFGLGLLAVAMGRRRKIA